MKKQVEAWIRFAEKDLMTVSAIIEKPELANVAAFHCQQAIEKYFKAFILGNGKRLTKVHNLMTLYGTIKEAANFEFDEDLLAALNDVYLESRYPGEMGLLDYESTPTNEQISKYFIFAKEVEAKIRELLNEND